ALENGCTSACVLCGIPMPSSTAAKTIRMRRRGRVFESVMTCSEEAFEWTDAGGARTADGAMQLHPRDEGSLDLSGPWIHRCGWGWRKFHPLQLIPRRPSIRHL